VEEDNDPEAEDAPPPPEDTDYTPSDRPELEAEAVHPWKGEL